MLFSHHLTNMALEALLNMHVPIVLGKCTFIILSMVGGLLFFRIHVKGVIEFFCDAGGGSGHFV
jgi:uncharacterized membrane protein